MRRRRWYVLVLLVCSALALLVVGFLLGVGWNARHAVTVNSALHLAFAAEQAAIVYKNASPHDALAVLEEHQRQLEAFEAGQATQVNVERVLTLVRLSSVAQELGHNDRAQEYKARAKRLCEDSNWRDCSDAAVGRLADKPSNRD